jgi:ABC-type nitrate/sulfonate/bicarbonate transport system substrate-binding protein
MKIAWTSPSGTMAGIWMAHDTGAWKEVGIDAELVHLASSSRMAAAMQAGEIDGGVLDWAVAFQFVAQGGNARQVAGLTSRQIFSIVSLPSLTRPQDVVGKRWGITRVGSSAHTASLVALEMWGLRPTDVQFLQLQEVPAIFAGLQAEQVDVGALSPPTNIRALQAGLRELVDLAEAGPEFPSVGLSVAERYVTGTPEVVRAYVAGYAMAVARFRKDRDLGIATLRKYLQLDDEAVLADTYARYSRYLAYPPLLPMDSLPRLKDDVARDDPRVAEVPISDVAVPRFVDDLQAQGFFASLL